MDHSADILQSWEANASNWITTIDQEEIESRKVATNAAIVETIKQYQIRNILDIGCGEGWLTRTLRSEGIEAIGVDAIEALVNNAIQKDGPYYKLGSYKDISAGKIALPASLTNAVINFALIDKEETAQLIHYLPRQLGKGGLLFIQTLHPLTVAAEAGYTSGWKEGSWKGLKQQFVLPYQWYFRTLEDWWSLFAAAGFFMVNIKEPMHPETQKPLSIIFVLRVP